MPGSDCEFRRPLNPKPFAARRPVIRRGTPVATDSAPKPRYCRRFPRSFASLTFAVQIRERDAMPLPRNDCDSIGVPDAIAYLNFSAAALSEQHVGSGGQGGEYRTMRL
jgi:hypothetical protein